MTFFLTQLPLFFLTAHAASTEEGRTSLWESIVHSNALNFILIVGLIGWVFNKFKIGGMVQNYRNKIATDIEAAETRKQQALTELATLEARTQALGKDIEKLMNEAKASAEQLSQQIIAEAQAEAERLLTAAQKRMALEEGAASNLLQAELIEACIAAVKERLAHELTDEQQAKTVDAFITQLPQLAGVGGGR